MKSDNSEAIPPQAANSQHRREVCTQMPLKPRTSNGNDPGSVQWGSCTTHRAGFVNLLNDDGSLYKASVPDITVLRMEIWNLKQGQVLTHDADWNPYRLQLDGFGGEKSESMDDWRRAQIAMVARSADLFARDENGALPVIVTENQCDMAKTHYQKTDMYRLAEQYKTVMAFADEARGLKGRHIRYANCKYLMRNDHALPDNPARKARGVEIAMQLLADLNLAGPLKYLTTLYDRGEEIDDMTDALLLSVQDQVDNAEDEARELIREARAFIKNIPRTPTVKRKRQRKRLLKPLTEEEARERAERRAAGEESSDEEPEPKPKAAKKTVAKPLAKKPKKAAPRATPDKKKRKESSSSGDESQELLEVKVIKKAAKRKASGPVLLDECSLTE
jgi:hypothetical protein